MTEIYAVLAGVTSYKELVEASSTMLGGNAFARLEEHMVKNDIFLNYPVVHLFLYLYTHIIPHPCHIDGNDCKHRFDQILSTDHWYP